ncbi:MAG TPA: hypothetical protein P5509_05395, partial [Bacteroidales bacterium]|nr:hypothetical protein [Bacteroidales bacterium]
MIITCEYCGKQFEHKSIRRFCSKSCANKFRWHKTDYRDKMIETMQSSEYKEKMSKSCKSVWKNPEYKNRMIEKHNSKETQEKRKKSFATESCFNKRSIASKKRWSEGFYDGMFTKELREKLSKIHREKWQNAEYAKTRFKKYKAYKKFELPSGRIIKLQGYEPIVMNELLQTYSEDDIICEVKNINKEIGKILYNYKGAERRYYPDFYIKSTNTIIEVKSNWTFEQHKEKNLA